MPTDAISAPDPSGWQTRITPEMRAAYRASGLWTGQMVHVMAAEKAARMPDAPALMFEAEPPASYAALWDEAQALAAGLQGLGLGPGDVVAFQLPNWREAAVVNLAVSAIGAIINPIIPIYRDAELRFILADAGAKAVFVPEQFRSIAYASMLDGLRPALPDLAHVIVTRPESDRHAITYPALVAAGRRQSFAPVAVDPDWIKLILYTSGTTGRPKGVLHTHNTMAASAAIGIDAWGLDRSDIMFMPSPVTHITGYSLGIEIPFLTEARTALMVRWDADQAIAMIDRLGCSMTVGATPFLQESVRAARTAGSRLPSMRFFACGGAAVPPDLVRTGNREWLRCRVFRMYGSSECPGITRGWLGEEEAELAATTDGKVYGFDVVLGDETGAILPADAEGEILARGAAAMVGYRDPAQTAEAFTPEGYFKTGDIGRLVPGGGVHITDRKKDLIIRGGENLSPKEIEDALHRHPSVEECAVVAMPHARLGEGVCACVIAAAGSVPSLAELAAHLETEGLARQKFPERLELMDAFPRTASGKIRKDVLRREIAARVEAKEK